MITNAQITRYMQLNKIQKISGLAADEKIELLNLKELYVKSLAEIKKTSVNDEDLKRISELSKRYKGEGLTDAEEEEYVTLRLAYVLASKRNISAQVNNIDVVSKDGKIENLGEKYGNK